jgi:hypothetical protein
MLTKRREALSLKITFLAFRDISLDVITPSYFIKIRKQFVDIEGRYKLFM